MFFTRDVDWKREVAVNLLGDNGYGRGVFIERRFGLEHSEVWEVRNRLDAALEARRGGRPRDVHDDHAIGACAGCQEKDREIARLRQDFAAERERGRKDLILQAAVLPGSTASIPLLERAVFGTSSGRETIRTYIQRASRNAAEFMRSLPWGEKIRRLASDEMFAGRTPILNCVEPRSMAVPVLQRGPDRKAETWQKVFERFPLLEVNASDQGRGILSAVEALGVLSQTDPWHANQELKRCLGILERDAYRRIREEYAAQRELSKRQKEKRPTRRAAQQHRKAKSKAAKAILRFDRACRAKPLLQQAIDPFDADGRWVSVAASMDLIQQGLRILAEVEAPCRKKVANAFDPDRILTFKAVIEAPLEFDEALPDLESEDLIEIAMSSTRSRPTDPHGETAWLLSRLLDERLQATCPTWSEHRHRIQDEIEHLFRSSSWSEAINSRVRVAQQVLKHLGDDFLALLALAHNATPFRGGKRKGKTPFELLGIKMPPGTWIDWVRPE